MRFEAYFSIEEICRRIPRSPKFFRAEIQRGAFSPARRADGSPDTSNIMLIDGSYFVPASGVAHYLDAHRLGATRLVELQEQREREAVDAPDLSAVSSGIPARSAGELRRKLGAVQTFGQEACNGC